MSTPANRVEEKGQNGPAQQMHQTLQASHAVARQAAGAHSDALAKLHGAIMAAHIAPPAPPDPAQGPDPGQAGGDPYANMPDPGGWVEQDPQGAASYAKAIMARFAELMMQHGLAPEGAPAAPDMAAPATTGAYGGGGQGPAF